MKTAKANILISYSFYKLMVIYYHSLLKTVIKTDSFWKTFYFIIVLDIPSKLEIQSNKLIKYNKFILTKFK